MGSSPSMGSSARNRFILVTGVVCVVTFALGILIGYFSAPSSHAEGDHTRTPSSRPSTSEMNQAHLQIMNAIDANDIEETHKYVTARPHIAGTARNHHLAKYLGKKFEDYKFDKVEYPQYDVLLSKLPPGKSSIITIYDSIKNEDIVTVTGKEDTADPSEEDDLLPAPYLGYAKAGIVTGKPIYVNYGRHEDFQKLKDDGIDINGKIAIMRFGKNYRGSKVANAAKFGAVGAIVFNDPQQYAPLGVDKTYPKTWWLPGSSAQRGSIFMGDGDPLTPALPAVNGTFRVSNDEANLPTIPAYPMNYNDVLPFMKNLSGNQAPADWQGGLPGVTYKVGPGFTNGDYRIKMDIRNEAKEQPIYNVIGTVIGSDEPDRYVMIGNHRDAWNFGGVDASSGTASMMGIAKAVGERLKTGWRPRRTLKFCSWDGEEFGLIGSYEHVEEHAKLISDRVVSYINVDISCHGNYSFRGRGSPVFRDFIFEAAKNVKDPFLRDRTMYDVWAERVPLMPKNGEPRYGVSGAGSDYAPFFHYLGMSIMDLTYMFSSENVTFYPVYHTIHDTHQWVKNFIDPHFHCMQSVAQLGSRLLLRLADLPVLPFVTKPFITDVKKKYTALKQNYETLLGTKKITLEHLKAAIDKLEQASNAFDARIAKVDPDKMSFQEARMINDQMMQFERTFVEPAGTAGSAVARHVIYTGSSKPKSYGFYAIGDLLYDIQTTDNWGAVKKELSFLTAAINLAAKSLEDVNL